MSYCRIALCSDRGTAIVSVLGLSAFDTIGRLHRMMPTADIEVLELEEERYDHGYSRTSWTPVGWKWRRQRRTARR